MAIRWKPGELDAAAKAIESHNRRIRAYNKRTGGDLPTIPKPKTMLKGLESRADLNRALKSLTKSAKDFEMVTTRTGIEMPKWQKREIEKAVRRINLERARRNQIIKAAAGDIDPGNRVMMGKLAEAEHRKKRPLGKVRKSDFASYYESIRKQSDPEYWKKRDQIYINSYIESLSNNLGAETARRIKDIISNLNPFDVVVESVTNEYLDHDFTYSELERSIKSELIEREWLKTVAKYAQRAILKR